MNKEENLLLKLAKIGSTYPSDPDAPRDGAANYGKPLREKWRVQADDPIEKCQEAKEQYVWVVFKEDGLLREPFLKKCFVAVAFWKNGSDILGVEILMATPNYPVRIPICEISHWQLIPTPSMPSKR